MSSTATAPSIIQENLNRQSTSSARTVPVCCCSRFAYHSATKRASTRHQRTEEPFTGVLRNGLSTDSTLGDARATYALRVGLSAGHPAELPDTQPNHEEFPIDWTRPDRHPAPLSRAAFVASRSRIDNLSCRASFFPSNADTREYRRKIAQFVVRRRCRRRIDQRRPNQNTCGPLFELTRNSRISTSRNPAASNMARTSSA